MERTDIEFLVRSFLLYGVFVYQTGRMLDDNFPVFSLVTNVVNPL